MDDQEQLLPNEIWAHIFSFNRHMIVEERKHLLVLYDCVHRELVEKTQHLWWDCIGPRFWSDQFRYYHSIPTLGTKKIGNLHWTFGVNRSGPRVLERIPTGENRLGRVVDK